MRPRVMQRMHPLAARMGGGGPACAQTFHTGRLRVRLVHINHGHPRLIGARIRDSVLLSCSGPDSGASDTPSAYSQVNMRLTFSSDFTALPAFSTF